MGILQIATVGDDAEPIMVGVREFPVSKLILIHTSEYSEKARQVAAALGPLKLETELRQVEGDLMLGVLAIVGDVCAESQILYEDVYINVAAGTRMTGCAATAAAFVNGIKAFGVDGGRPMLLPVLRFSYHELISEAKLAILKTIDEQGGSVESLQQLADAVGGDKSLLSYHIRGGRESKGLEDLNLVEIDRGQRGRLTIRLTPMGKMLLNGRAAPPRPVPEAPEKVERPRFWRARRR